ncbi:MAG: hypothetical protein RBR97_12220 [Bacteroidales bacterium]|nr:hypothetical protein [Bacteroidales bacterium]
MTWLITTQSRPLIRHQALVYSDGGVLMAVHNSRDKGGVIRQPLVDFVKGKRVTQVKELTYSSDYIHSYYCENKHRKYDLLNYNCEHFTTGAIGSVNSPQVKQLLFGSSLLALLLMIRS